ncbi:MAG: DUF2681 domain-containing protein [Acidobacteriota bacterium]|nr:DUF2681 domain-containing protein [Acidobacteriota bacterium]
MNKLIWMTAVAIAVAATANAQTASTDATQKMLDRLDTLEKQNAQLLDEIRQLRQEVKERQVQQSEANDRIEDRVAVTETRIDEHTQTKLSSSQRFPISLTGMFLFDASLSYGPRNPIFESTYQDETLGPRGGDATLRQSIIGFEFHGPKLPGDGQVHGSLAMDFYANNGNADLFRIRRGVVSFDWKRRSIAFGQEKPLISPLQPTSFARVGVPPLAGAGNLWLWLPQVRYEERMPFSAATQASLSGALIETDEEYSGATLPPQASLQSYRPGFEARGEIKHTWSYDSRFVLGFGGHVSSTHLNGGSVPSRLVSMDLDYKPLRWIGFSGTIVHGENFSNLGGIPPGVTINGVSVTPVHGTAGWVQVALPVTSQLTFDAYAGRQLNRATDLSAFQIVRSLTYAANALYKIAPNVVLGIEAAQDRIDYLNHTAFKTNRYDLTAAYLF